MQQHLQQVCAAKLRVRLARVTRPQLCAAGHTEAVTANTENRPLQTEPQPLLDPARTYELDRKHVFHSWSAQAKITPMTLVSASGSHVWDGEGRRYLDFSSQLVYTNIG